MITQLHFRLQFEKQLLQNHKVFGKITKATMVHHLTPKKVHIDGPIFLKKSILLIYFRALLEKLYYQTVASMDILLQAERKLST